jgi:hypothetical protein
MIDDLMLSGSVIAFLALILLSLAVDGRTRPASQRPRPSPPRRNALDGRGGVRAEGRASREEREAEMVARRAWDEFPTIR